MSPRIAVVLPPREGFSPQAVGAIGLLVHRISRSGEVVIGRASSEPAFPDRDFRPVPRLLLPRLRRDGGYAAATARLLRELRPDLVEVHNRPALAERLARTLPWMRFSLTLHNDPCEMRGTARPAQRAALLASMPVVTVSDHLRRRFLDGVSAAREPLVLPNCLDLAALPPPRPPAAREPRILFVGRAVADKGADSFVAACAIALPALPGWTAEIIGADRFSADGPHTPFLQRLQPAAAAASVALRGYQPHAEVLAAMARAAIVVVPSRWAEPFGMTALEAMASGAALITTRRGGLPEVAGEAALYVDPDAPHTLAAAIRALAEDPERRAALAAAGRARAERFDLPAALAARASFRREMLARAPCPR